MLISLRPYLNFGLRRLGLEKSMGEAAFDVSIMQPEEIQEIPPIVYLAGQLDKVTKGFEGREPELGSLKPGPIRHPAVLRYRLKNCLVHDAGFDVNGFSFRLKKFVPGLRAGPTKEISAAIYTMTSYCHTYFGHWLSDACATALLRRPGEALFLEERSDWSHARSYIEAFGYLPLPPWQFLVREMVWYQDHGQGSSKRERYAIMRQRLAAAFPTGPRSAAAVYLRRGDTGIERLVDNELQLIRELSKRGFEILDLKTETLERIYLTCRDAKIVVSVEGSHMNHSYLAMQPGTRVVALVPGDRFVLTGSDYARAVGLRFGFVVTEPTEDGHQVDINDLLRTIDLIAA